MGSAMIVESVVELMELAHLSYKKHTFEYDNWRRGLGAAGEVEKSLNG